MSKALYYKTKEEIELIRESSLLVSKTLGEIAKVIGPGVKTIDLNNQYKSGELSQWIR